MHTLGKLASKKIIYPRKMTSSSTDCAKHIMSMFENNTELKIEFTNGISKMKTAFPTKYNPNKFMLGNAVEYWFVEMLNKHNPDKFVKLCDKNETRNDIICHNSFAFSIKYCTPSKQGVIPNIRLINKHSAKLDKEYSCDENIFIIVPSTEITKNIEENIYNIETNRWHKKDTKIAQALLDKYDEDYLISCMNKKYSGKLIFIPKEEIHQDALRHTQDGVELKSTFIQQYIKDPENAQYIVCLDIGYAKDIEEMDIIRLGMERLLQCDLQYISR